MSEKKAKADRKIKVIANNTDPQSIAEDMAKSITKMYEDRDKKAVGAKEHLVAQLKVTADKYRTANGVMSALQTVRSVFGEQAQECTLNEEISIAKGAAIEMSVESTDMAKKASELKPDDMEQLCEGFYDTDFAQSDGSVIEMIHELMRLQLCQNVGPDAQDITDFCKTADQEITKAREDLRAYCHDNDVDFLKACGVKKYSINLCTECVKDCKDDSKTINEEQSAREVCEEFEFAE